MRICRRTTRTGRLAALEAWGRLFVVSVMVEVQINGRRGYEVVSLDEYGDLREAMAEFRRLR